MCKRRSLLLLGVLFGIAVFWWISTPTRQQRVVPTIAPLERPASAALGIPSAPVRPRVVDQRPPVARDGTTVVAQYGFVGAIGDEAGGTQYLFTRADQSFSVALGGVLEGLWRVDSVEVDRVRLTRLTDGIAGVIPFSNAGSGSLELPRDAVVLAKPPQPTSRRSLRSRHP
ncbi:MAG: hypothetical protein WCP04_09625 [Pseudomonadota bacterium]|jgi:hypothetical protein